MPFWWPRRNKWYTPYRYRRNYYKRFQRKRRRPKRKFRHRRPIRRRRRRRRRKVRRKKQSLIVRQWQPDSITKCFIKGVGTLVLGCQGTQFQCYTFHKEDFTPPKYPTGGGFGVEQFSLSYLYEEYRFHNNIWTKSNILKDLCRYIKCKFTFYSHQYVDFIVCYDRQPPFNLTQFTYTQTHPQLMLLQKHKKLILSYRSKPNGKHQKSITIKPPKQMLSKWFFSDQFCNAGLHLLTGSACDLQYAHMSPTATNTQITIISLNIEFYKNGDWGQVSGHPYRPYDTIYTGPLTINYLQNNQPKQDTFNSPTTYYESVSITQGYFYPHMLQATSIQHGSTSFGALPTLACRYNPEVDSGEGNTIWLCSTITKGHDKPADPVLIYKNLPLWLMFWGWLDYVLTMKKDKTFLDSYYILIQSPAIKTFPTTSTQTTFIPIDKAFYDGRDPYTNYLTVKQKQLWFPTVKKQLQTINAIVSSGPYVPKLSEERQSSWELKYFYKFLFKFGGPTTTDPQIEDPKKQGHYDVPDHLQQIIQIKNPAKQSPTTILHSWDYRRGIIKETALKRISENLQIDSDFEPDEFPSAPPPKRRKGAALSNPQEKEEEIQECLQNLYKENPLQETQETPTIQQLIQQQQQQQQELKFNILHLISDLKNQQRQLQLHTGILN
nr:MAG: ORF1 [Torque teno midi virus]